MFTLHKLIKNCWEIGNTNITLCQLTKGHWRVEAALDFQWVYEHGFHDSWFPTRQAAYRAAVAAYGINAPNGEHPAPLRLIKVDDGHWVTPDREWRVQRSLAQDGFVACRKTGSPATLAVSTLRAAAITIASAPPPWRSADAA